MLAGGVATGSGGGSALLEGDQGRGIAFLAEGFDALRAATRQIDGNV